jgi:8-oxo-dGTP pyrophosphatase MutT (NUDIX family)
MKRAVLIILERDGKVLFAKRTPQRKDIPSMWSLPSETMEPDEDVLGCAIRCAKEELGVLLTLPTLYDSYKFEPPKNKMLYYVKGTFLGEPSILVPEELDNLQWLSWEEFYSQYLDSDMGHGLQYLRGKLS